jgi:hypothetical protein
LEDIPAVSVHRSYLVYIADLITVGMRFAKLEQNIITAYFIASFDFSLQDKSGNKMTVAPQIDFNRHSAHKPKNQQFLKVTPRDK